MKSRFATLLRRLFMLAALAAVGVGIWYGRRELNDPVDTTGAGLPLPREERGRGSIADSRVVAQADEPEWVQELAGYVPGPITSRRFQALAWVWAAPSTLVGLVLGLLSGATPTPRDGVLVFSPVRGFVGAALAKGGFAATTMGHVVLARREPSEALMAHELVHTRQAERFGPFMGPLYYLLLIRYGYARHPMERAARIAGRQAAHVSAGHTRPTKPPISRT